VVHLPASGSNRVALLATVEIAPGRSVEVACTHITTHLDQAPTSGFRSWRLEQAAQFVRISRRLQARAGHRPQLLVGDMNFGQRHGSVNTVMWPSWKLAADAGFVSPAEYAKPPVYSFCSGSCLNPTSSKVLIDHVMIRQSDRHWGLRAICAEKAFERPVRIIDRHGRRRLIGLSDHLGISVAFKIRGPIVRPRQP
jgi:endonuclease/exonuclease/phosphatase family metal-dependent hydrolase